MLMSLMTITSFKYTYRYTLGYVIEINLLENTQLFNMKKTFNDKYVLKKT